MHAIPDFTFLGKLKLLNKLRLVLSDVPLPKPEKFIDTVQNLRFLEKLILKFL